MRSLALAAAFLAPALVAAVPWAGPEPTYTLSEDPAIYGASPAPTKGPKVNEWILELFKRQSDPDATCGYEDALSESIVTCRSGRVCATNSLWNAAGCCDPLNMEGCLLKTSCIPAAYMTSCTGSCLTDGHIAKCTAAGASWCYVRKWDFDTTTMTELGCDSVRGTYTVAQTYSGQVSLRSSKSIYAAPTVVTVTQSTDEDEGPTGSVVAASTGTASPTGTGSSISIGSGRKSKKSSSGGIIGGVVGGLLAIGGLVIGLIVFCLKKQKRKREQAATNAAAGAGSSTQDSSAQQPLMSQQTEYKGPNVPAAGVSPVQNPAYMQQQPYPGQQPYDPNAGAAASYYGQPQQAGPLPSKQEYVNVSGQTPGALTPGGQHPVSPYSPPGSPAPQYSPPAGGAIPGQQQPMAYPPLPQIAEVGGTSVPRPADDGRPVYEMGNGR